MLRLRFLSGKRRLPLSDPLHQHKTTTKRPIFKTTDTTLKCSRIKKEGRECVLVCLCVRVCYCVDVCVCGCVIAWMFVSVYDWEREREREFKSSFSPQCCRNENPPFLLFSSFALSAAQPRFRPTKNGLWGWIETGLASSTIQSHHASTGEQQLKGFTIFPIKRQAWLLIKSNESESN